MSPKLINILLIVSSAALYYIFIGPIWSGVGSILAPERGGVKTLIATEAKYKDTLSKADDLFKQGNELSSQYKAVKDTDKQKMLLMVPEKIEKIRLLSEMDKIANLTGMSLANVFVLEEVSTDKLKGAYAISFSVKTTYSNFKKFMRNYENSLRLFTLESVKFAVPAKIDDPIDFKVTLKTYYLK